MLTDWDPAARKEVILESRSIPNGMDWLELFLGGSAGTTNASGSSKSDPVDEVGEGASTTGDKVLLVAARSLGKLGVISSNFRLTAFTRLPNCL